jgi:hypothetical protein
MRLHRLRRLLSYANVMATLAFFFALTGGATAAVKYLTTSTPITQGDLAGSTYGNPLIADGKVTSAKLASDATAPNASELGGHPASDFPLVFTRGSVTVPRPYTLPAGTCNNQGTDAVSGLDRSTDFAVANPPLLLSGAITVNAAVDAVPGGQNGVSLRICNNNSFDVDASGTYTYIVLR